MSDSRALEPEKLEELYRRLHQHPELSMQEEATAALVHERMSGLGFETSRCGGGVVAVLRNGEGPVVALRAELDGLPVEEQTGVDFASTARGVLADGTSVPVMHACGHDLHIVWAIGASAALAASRTTWSGTLVVLFQPGEETGEGARTMLADGLWERTPKPGIIMAQHVTPQPVGTAELSEGVAMAMSDTWQVTVAGRGGHGSQPEATIDPIVLAAHMIVRVQSIVSREIGAQQSAVVTVGSIRGGDSPNVIPSSVEFTLNIRSLDPELRSRVHAALRRVLEAEALASGAPAPEIRERHGFPLLKNDPAAAREVAHVLRGAFGEESVTVRPPLMGSEDFGHLGAAIGVPSVYWFLGGFPPANGEPSPPNHSPRFLPLTGPAIDAGVTAAVAVLRSRLSAGPSNHEQKAE